MRCPCGNRVLRGQTRCLTCFAWERRQGAGSAPEFQRAAAPTTGVGTMREEGASSRAAAIFRHPSGRPRLHLVSTDDPCPLHPGNTALGCEGCIRKSETDWESRDGIA